VTLLLEPLRGPIRITDQTTETALLRVTGSDRLSFLTRVMSGDLPAAGVCPTALLGPKGNLRAVGTAVVLPDRVDIECDASASGGLLQALDRYRITDDVELELVTRITAIRVEGKEALRALPQHEDGIGEDAGDFRAVPDGHVRRELRPWPSFFVVRETAPEEQSRRLESLGAVPASPEEAHWLRIAAGEPRWGSEADERSLPLQCGFDSHVRLGRGCYIGQEYVARQAHRGRVTQALLGLRLEDDAPASPGTRVLRDGRAVGRITSSASLPEATIALGLLGAEVAAGDPVRVGETAAEVTPLPFPIESL